MMTNTLTAAAFGLVSASGIVLSNASLSGATSVPLNEAIAVMLTVGGLVWWLGRKFQNLEKTQRQHGKLLEMLLEKNGQDPRVVGGDNDEP